MKKDIQGEIETKFSHPMHPAVVHFPIAFFPLSSLFLALWFIQDRNPFYLNAAYWLFMAGALMILPVVATGIRDMLHTNVEDHHGTPRNTGYRTLFTHVIIGSATAFISTISALYFLFNKPMDESNLIPGFTLISLLLTVLVFSQGFIGGLMVYTHHMGVHGHTHK